MTLAEFESMVANLLGLAPHHVRSLGLLSAATEAAAKAWLEREPNEKTPHERVCMLDELRRQLNHYGHHGRFSMEHPNG